MIWLGLGLVRVGFGLVVFMPYQNRNLRKSFQNIISTENCLVSGVGVNRLSEHFLVPVLGLGLVRVGLGLVVFMPYQNQNL